MTGADAIEAAMVVMALALIGYAVVSLIEARRRKGRRIDATDDRNPIASGRSVEHFGLGACSLSGNAQFPEPTSNDGPTSPSEPRL